MTWESRARTPSWLLHAEAIFMWKSQRVMGPPKRGSGGTLHAFGRSPKGGCGRHGKPIGEIAPNHWTRAGGCGGGTSDAGDGLVTSCCTTPAREREGNGSEGRTIKCSCAMATMRPHEEVWHEVEPNPLGQFGVFQFSSRHSLSLAAWLPPPNLQQGTP